MKNLYAFPHIRQFTWLAAIAFAASLTLVVVPTAHAKVDIEGKVVLANADRYAAHFRAGKTRKTINPRKASVLSPKRFPITLEIWSGNRGGAAWEKQSITAAGVYVFRFQQGRWQLAKHQARASTPRTTSSRAPISRRPTYNRATGSAPRVVRGRGRVYYGPRVPTLARIAGSAMCLYRFVRDEQDRDLLRDIIIGREIDREVEREIIDKWDALAVTLPAAERLEFERAIDDLRNVSERDLRDLEDATDEDWGQARDYLGDTLDDDAWRDFEGDFKDVDIDDMSEGDNLDLDDAGIDTMDMDVDLGDLDAGDADLGGLGGSLDDIDLGDVGGGIDDIDIGDIGGNFDFNDFGGGGGDFGGDPGGGADFGGDFGGGGFDYDAGGFDDFGGGFDDFGGGGFDDFGGGFDDF